MICVTEKVTGTEVKYRFTDCFFIAKAQSLEKTLRVRQLVQWEKEHSDYSE